MADDNEQDFTPDDFTARFYGATGPALDKAETIEHAIMIDGQVVTRFKVHEPGALVFLSRPDQQGIAIVSVQQGGARLTDYPDSFGRFQTIDAPDWVLEALGLPRRDGHRSPDNAI